ncbi:MAG: YegS/Rv2252/BmrU family lipid kinase [Clostridia bacterium]|nr:YegS/Rv2252/BmrU family lipid kinase [Clostridia bacterium]
MSNKLLFIVNPVSGRAKAKTVLFDILSVFASRDFVPTVHITRRQGDARLVTAKWASEYDRVVCCGGDGTLNEVISGVMDAKTDTPIGYIPLGSTNDFAASMCIPVSPVEAAEHATSDNIHRLDIGRFRERYFSYIASFGAFTAASYSAPQTTKNMLGHAAYVFEGVKDIVNIRPLHVRLEADGNTYDGHYVFGAITNSTSVGGIVKLSPQIVDRQDGLFEVTLVKPPQNLMDLNKIITALSAGDFSGNPMFQFFKASSLKVFSEDFFDWSLDGEHVKGTDEIKIQNLKQAVRFIL